MGAGHSRPPIKDWLKQVDRPSARRRKATDSQQEPQQSDKDGVTVGTVLQETDPSVRAPTPWVPAEPELAAAPEILDENDSGIGETTLEDILSDAMDISTEPFTMPSMPSGSNIAEPHRSHNMQGPPESSQMGAQSAVQPLANPPGNNSLSEPLPEHTADAIPVSDQITIKPLAMHLRNLPSSATGSGNIAATSEHTSNPDACHFCETLYSDNSEPKVHLPCGHSFGIVCLHQWFQAALSIAKTREISVIHLRCPHDCVSLRYRCGHLVTPSSSAPDPLYTDVSAIAIPSDYGYCKMGRGRRLCQDIKRLQKIENHLVGDPDHLLARGNRRKALDVFWLRRPPFSGKILLMVKKLRNKAESRLCREHQIWWLKEWYRAGHLQINGSLFTTDYQIEDVLRKNFLRELSDS